MSTEGRPEFDFLVGGEFKVPSTIGIKNYATARIEELTLLKNVVLSDPEKGQIFQRLPRHMRRRQMSHVSKRLPRQYQSLVPSVSAAVTKRPSRKYKRKPSNLLMEYNRRQRKHVWLETHIWHAKRFHMTEKWGYKLPEKPTNKSFRMSYRASTQHVLVNDISYENCIELSGRQDILLNCLQKHCSSDCGLTFAAKMFISGNREGHLMLYHPNGYPNKAIGCVRFMWSPVGSHGDGCLRKIWIWVHPLIHEEVVESFVDCLQLTKDTTAMEICDVKEPQGSERVKLGPRNVPYDRTPKFYNNQSGVTLVLLKDTLNRFRLTGPLSQTVLHEVFTVGNVRKPEVVKDSGNDVEITESDVSSDVEIIQENDSVKGAGDSHAGDTLSTWWTKFYNNESNLLAWKHQKDFFGTFNSYLSPSEFPAQLILSLTIKDPRFDIPVKRSKALQALEESATESDQLVSLKSEYCQSPIWEPSIRDEVSFSKLSTCEINNIRSKLLVPGQKIPETWLTDEKSLCKIPILLINRPGVRDALHGMIYNCGWDIIAPAGWGMPIWTALQYRGARAGGLREIVSVSFEEGSLKYIPPPDSKSGAVYDLERYQKLRTKHFKYPPSKRLNYKKLGVVSPFYCDWSCLVKDWLESVKMDVSVDDEMDDNDSNGSYFVIRDVKHLQMIQHFILSLNGKMKPNMFDKTKIMEVLRDQKNSRGLIPVQIESLNKGIPHDYCMLCLPSTSDYSNLASDQKFIGPVEPPHFDNEEVERKSLRKEHKKLMEALRRKRKKKNKDLRDNINSQALNESLKLSKKGTKQVAPTLDISEKFKKKCEMLWLSEPGKIKNIADSCSRKMVGFVVKGDFSFRKAGGVALGYVCVPGFIQLLNLNADHYTKPVVLYRNTDSLQYRFASFSVRTNI